MYICVLEVKYFPQTNKFVKKQWIIVNINEWALTDQDIGPINGSRVKIRGHNDYTSHMTSLRMILGINKKRVLH